MSDVGGIVVGALFIGIRVAIAFFAQDQAKHKGRSRWYWATFGVLQPALALFYVTLASDLRNQRHFPTAAQLAKTKR